jgi:hypothetical protein
VAIPKGETDSETPASSCTGVQLNVSEQNEQWIPLTFSVAESGVEVWCMRICVRRKLRVLGE